MPFWPRAMTHRVAEASGRADELHADVGGDVLPLEALDRGQGDADGRVEVPAGDVADAVDHDQHGEAEGQRDTEEADAEAGVLTVLDEVGREHRRAAAAEHQHVGAEELRYESSSEWHGNPHQFAARPVPGTLQAWSSTNVPRGPR